MARNLDSTLSTNLASRLIEPALFVKLGLRSGVQYVWSGVGDFVFNGNTYAGVGLLGSIGAITEASSVKAEGTTVTLAGVGLSQVGWPALTVPAPPFSPPSGQSVAWSLPKRFAAGGPSAKGSVVGSPTGAVISLTMGLPLDPGALTAEWYDFQRPPEIPLGSTIVGIYSAVTVEAVSPGSIAAVVDTVDPSGFAPQVAGDIAPATYYGGNMVGTIPVITASLDRSLFGATSDGMTVSSVAVAYYYEGSPLSTATLIYEALNDVRLGADAKIWFGLMENGALLGTPYLVFSGTVDKPTVTPSPHGATVTLALENRLINLQRPTQRRYTAADQHLANPLDMAFNWVEALNDMSLKEGES